MQELKIDFPPIEIRGLLPDQEVREIAYVLEPVKVLYSLAEFQKRNKGTAIVTIFGMDWDNDLSPWHEKKIFKKGRDFGGHADAFRRTLLEEIIPSVESQLPAPPAKRYLAGISLAGLFALHTSCFTPLFDGIASISGSLWFQGFLPWLRERRPQLSRAYFSIGQKEKDTRNPIIATTEDCSREAALLLENQRIETKFEINPGGHFDDGPIRIEKALRWLLRNVEEENNCKTL